MGTFLIQTPKSSFDGRYQKVSIDAYTPLLELKEGIPPLGYSILKNGNVMSNAYKIVSENMRAPVIKTASDDKLYNDFVANTSDTWLTFTKDLLSNAKYNLGLDEVGRVLFLPDTAIFSPAIFSHLLPQCQCELRRNGFFHWNIY